MGRLADLPHFWPQNKAIRYLEISTEQIFRKTGLMIRTLIKQKWGMWNLQKTSFFVLIDSLPQFWVQNSVTTYLGIYFRNCLNILDIEHFGHFVWTFWKLSEHFQPSDFAAASSKEFLDIQANIECGFTLKHVRGMTRTYSQMHRIDKYSQHSSIIWPVWLNGWVFVYELSDCGFESSCSHLTFRFRGCFEQRVPWHSGKYRVRIHSETRTWHDKDIQSNAP